MTVPNNLYVHLFQILCLLTFVIVVAHEKYLLASNNKVMKRKKKPSESGSKTLKVPSEKERAEVISVIINRLKEELGAIDSVLGKKKTIFLFC